MKIVVHAALDARTNIEMNARGARKFTGCVRRDAGDRHARRCVQPRRVEPRSLVVKNRRDRTGRPRVGNLRVESARAALDQGDASSRKAHEIARRAAAAAQRRDRSRYRAARRTSRNEPVALERVGVVRRLQDRRAIEFRRLVVVRLDSHAIAGPSHESGDVLNRGLVAGRARVAVAVTIAPRVLVGNALEHRQAPPQRRALNACLQLR